MIQAAQPLQVAVIGAGISGVLTAAYLENAGLQVTVFERANVAGGVWSVIYLTRRVMRQLN
jgi:phytoene dehydrogenase-like protein